MPEPKIWLSDKHWVYITSGCAFQNIRAVLEKGLSLFVDSINAQPYEYLNSSTYIMYITNCFHSVQNMFQEHLKIWL